MPDSNPGLLAIQTGRLPDVVTEFGALGRSAGLRLRQARHDRGHCDALIANGTAAERIHFDPQVAG